MSDHPTPEALRKLADDIDAGRLGSYQTAQRSMSALRQAADTLEALAASLDAARGESEAQQRQLAVARRLTQAVEAHFGGARLAWLIDALHEAREAGLTENTSAESAPIGKNICGLGAEGGDR
jgi:hypothetical protein